MGKGKNSNRKMDYFPVISIIIPVYNAENTLKDCIESVLQQTYQNYEIIAVDDGSSDSSLHLLNKYAEEDERVHVIVQERNGVSAARNTGIKSSKGRYITFLDADDIYMPQYLEKMISAKIKYNADVVMCGYIFGASGKHINLKECLYSEKKEYLEELKVYIANNCMGYSWNKLYDRRLIFYFFPEDIQWGEDMMFNLNYFRNCHKISILSECLYRYQTSSKESLSSRYDVHMIDTIQKLKGELEKYAGELWCRKHLDFIVNWMWNLFLRNAFRLCSSDELSYKKKKSIFNEWKTHNTYIYLLRNKMKIKKYRKLLYIYQFDVWYIIIFLWNQFQKYYKYYK